MAGFLSGFRLIKGTQSARNQVDLQENVMKSLIKRLALTMAIVTLGNAAFAKATAIPQPVTSASSTTVAPIFGAAERPQVGAGGQSTLEHQYARPAMGCDFTGTPRCYACWEEPAFGRSYCIFG